MFLREPSNGETVFCICGFRGETIVQWWLCRRQLRRPVFALCIGHVRFVIKFQGWPLRGAPVFLFSRGKRVENEN